MDEPINADQDQWGRYLKSLILDQNKGLAAMQSAIVANNDAIRRLADDQEVVLEILNGSERTGLVGLRKRIESMESVINRWSRWEWYVKGLAVGVTLNGVISVASLITILTKVTIP
jgi:hypothetical protein